MEAFIIQMTFKVGISGQAHEKVQRFHIREVLIGRSDDSSFGSTFYSSLDIFRQEYQAGFLDKADREIKCLAATQVHLNG